eukprot:1610958-Rhodomonas_salina.1
MSGRIRRWVCSVWKGTCASDTSRSNSDTSSASPRPASIDSSYTCVHVQHVSSFFSFKFLLVCSCGWVGAKRVHRSLTSVSGRGVKEGSFALSLFASLFDVPFFFSLLSADAPASWGAAGGGPR